jgi:molybdopterin/thiamine biosynthesis adenylyltransferase
MSINLLHIGCGAIGSNTATHLPSGVDHVLLCDKDTVGVENLGIADFTRSDVGLQKVDAVARRLAGCRPSLRVSAVATDVSILGPGVIEAFDMVSVAVDNDKAAYTVSRIVALSAKQPCIVFANCDSTSGAAQVRVVNFPHNKACIGCSRSQNRWSAPLSTPHSCARGSRRAAPEAAQFAAALQVSTVRCLLDSVDRQKERAGESLLIDPSSGKLVRSRMTYNESCPAMYHAAGPSTEPTFTAGGSRFDLELSDLLEIVAGRLGAHAFIDLGERWWCTEFQCASCNADLHMPRLIDSAPHCSCGGRMTPKHGSRRIDAGMRQSSDAHIRLSECGFAEGDVIPVASPEGCAYIRLDLSPAWRTMLYKEGAHA